jgi:hypothetical protein
VKRASGTYMRNPRMSSCGAAPKLTQRHGRASDIVRRNGWKSSRASKRFHEFRNKLGRHIADCKVPP